ncbi:PKPA [Enterospora canceri]|uniref:PKPA n=1 Tax=Enterospora canceri TaxID=1081671 RepID=A0A1Y1S8Q5_9MICR|nr:PKPA [Enterospora canceri]
MKERYKKTNVVLGEGSYKTVSKAVDNEEGKEVAYNEVLIKKYEAEVHSHTSFSKEIALLKNIDHPNIIKILDYWFDEDNFVFITELMTGGTLLDYVQKNGALSDKLVQKWGRQVLAGIGHLHGLSPPIIHRDIKAENVFVNSAQGEVKIGDLGIAKERKYKRYTIIGTLNYMAREMFEGDGYSEAVDVYAFGMTLIQMATGRTPYAECAETTDVKRSVLQGCPPEALKHVRNRCLRHLIVSCITAAPNRLSAAACLRHHFFNGEAERECGGKCMAQSYCMIYPLGRERDMLLSMVAYGERSITFQVQLKETGTLENFRFIKFEYDLDTDTVEKICDELAREKVVQKEAIGHFQILLRNGIERAHSMKKARRIHQGMFEVGKDEMAGERRLVIGEEAKKVVVEDVDSRSVVEQKERETSTEEAVFGANTMEIMQEIEEEIKGAGGKQGDDEKIQEAAQIYQLYMTTTGSADSLVEKNSGSTVTLTKTKATSIARAYEITRERYQRDVAIEEFTLDACRITQRDLENGKYWGAAFIENDILTTGDLKLLTADDWEKLNLTLFACRTMQNMLYGQNSYPPRNRQLVYKKGTKEYAYSTPIDEFVGDVCKTYGKKEFMKGWLGAFTGQDLRTFGELKGLTESDWDRLGLSVLGFRIFFNVVFKKGFVGKE